MENLKNNIKKLELINMNDEELSYVQKPIGKALYRGRPKKDVRVKYNDRVICEICNKEFTRSNRSAHNKTKTHMLLAKVNNNLRKILIN